MLLVFIDETSDAKFKDYLGFSIAHINSRFYPSLKIVAQKILLESGWNSSTEFKGSYLFSKTQGCTDVEIERRVAAAHRLLDLNVASSNSRLRFHYGRMVSTTHGSDYVRHLPILLNKSLPAAPPGAGKNLISIQCDERSDVKSDELHEALSAVASKRGYVLLERIVTVKSTFDTVGLMFADLVGYLAARIDTINSDAELFESLTTEQKKKSGKLRKLQSSTELISKIKQLTLYEHK